MAQQIYTIPVNEAFDAVQGSAACPFCKLYRTLEENELETVLGAAMMEPAIRIETNRQGFCRVHFKKMLKRKKMLPLGLILESHLDEAAPKVTPPMILGRKPDFSPLGELEESCYVCARIERNHSAMIATAVYLFEHDTAFRKKFEAATFFCLPHYRAMLTYASKKCDRKSFAALYQSAKTVNETYIKSLSGDVCWFCKKFDYRYDAEPWYNAKDALPRAVDFLCGVMGDGDDE